MNKVVLPPLPGYAELSKGLGPVTANLLCVTRWKDGIDIEEPDAALAALLRARDLEVVKCVLETAAGVCRNERLMFGDEEWNVRLELADAIRALEFTHG